MRLNETLTAVEGLRVGHAQDKSTPTGCTVILFDPEADVAVKRAVDGQEHTIRIQ